MKIAILHDEVPSDARPDELDALVQADAVAAALAALGHAADRIAFGLNLALTAAQLRAAAPALVFNLVEAPGATGRLIHFAPALLDWLQLPYAGAGADAVYQTSNKLAAKRMLCAAGIPTPAHRQSGVDAVAPFVPGEYIIKSVWEHASVGLDEESVAAYPSAAALDAALARRAAEGEWFAERYVDGREFNLSLLARAEGESGEPQILPPAEIDFAGYSSQKRRIVGYRAKWVADSFEFHHTPRRYDFPPADAPLLDELAALALRCWRCFGLRGWARVDFRVDAAGRPWVLEVNTNPCLSPDAGFAAALQRAEVPFFEAVRRIIADVNPVPPRAAQPKAAVVSRAGESSPSGVDIREDVRPSDSDAVGDIVTRTGFFRPDEVAIAVELVHERLARGPESGYHFLFAESAGAVVGYACYGPIACTIGSYDLFWIVVDPRFQGAGLGRRLLQETEQRIQAAGGRSVYIETSGKPQYLPTRGFYERCGYAITAVLKDFYAQGDDKVVFARSLV